MKKLLLFTAVAFFAFTTAQSQEFRIGFKGGVNIATLGGDTFYGSLNTRASFHIGGLVEIPLVGKFSIQPELLYSSQGSKYDYYGGLFDDSFDGAVKLDYISIPVMAKFYIIEGLSAEAGPVFSILVSAKEDDFNDDGDVESFDAKEDYKSFDAAIAIGASYRLDMGVFFSLRYNKGLLDINDIDGYNGKNQNNVFQVSAGYSF